ncbi:MAG: AAA family ATPase [Halomonadaceae bacterium]|nr:AAA family ATPase [Halomonadaceae bacterium]
MMQNEPFLQAIQPVSYHRLNDIYEKIDQADTTVRKIYTAPDSERTLNLQLSSTQAARILGISKSYFTELRKKTPGAPQGVVGGNNHPRFCLADLEGYRAILEAKGRIKYPAKRRKGEPLTTICVANLKGGVSKTTLSTNLATHLALHGYRTLLVDLDPQASATGVLDPSAESYIVGEDTIENAMLYSSDRIKGVIRPTAWSPMLDLVPSSTDLEILTTNMLAPGNDNQLAYWDRLKAAIDVVADDYDVVILDTPPNLQAVTQSAVWASDFMIMPAGASWMDLRAMRSFFRILHMRLQEIDSYVGEAKNFLGLRIMISNYKGPAIGGDKEPVATNIEFQIAAIMRKVFGHYMADSMLPNCSAFQAASAEMKTVHELLGSDKTNKRAQEAMFLIGREIMSLIHSQRYYAAHNS